MKKFWLVWNSERPRNKLSDPVVRHPTRIQANDEAMRLSAQESGEYFVLEAVSVVKSFLRREIEDHDLENVDA